MTRARLASLAVAAAVAVTLGACGSAPHLVDVAPPTNDDGTVNVVVEIPAGTHAKFEVDETSGRLRQDTRDGAPRVVRFLGYPGNYGLVPRTLLPRSEGGDGDPLDVIVLGGPVARGSVVRARIVAVLRTRDEGERDDKIVAVDPGGPLGGAHDLAQLDARHPGVTAILATWFASYDGVGTTVVEGWGDADEARAMIATAAAAYAQSRGK